MRQGPVRNDLLVQRLNAEERNTQWGLIREGAACINWRHLIITYHFSQYVPYWERLGIPNIAHVHA
jgi:hypothetical protein